LTQSHNTLMHLSLLGKVFTFVMAEIRLLNFSCCRIGDLQVLCHWPKNNSPMNKVSTICWIFLTLPDCSNSLCLLYSVWDCITVLKDHTTWQMFMPLPANSLMQSEQHVTAYVHIHYWISKYECNSHDSCSVEYRCHILPACWHTLHFVALNEDGSVHCITAYFE